MKKIVVASVLFVVLVAAWMAAFIAFGSSEQELFPARTFPVYTVTDSVVGGFSTSEVSESDSAIRARVNIRSGVAYAYAGFGFNMQSLNNRPVGFFDFAGYDSLLLEVETGRMRNISVKLLNDDPVFSKEKAFLSLRPLVASAPVGKGSVAIPLYAFKVPEWWLVMQGMDKDDGLRYMQRGVLMEIYNGEGTLRGIPDDITVRSVKLVGENRTFKALMYVGLVVLILVFGGYVALLHRNSESSRASREASRKALEGKMQKARELLKDTDRSMAEIAIAVGEKNVGAFEKNFKKVFGEAPQEYRKK